MYSKKVKTFIGKRQYAYVYILHKLFNGDVKEFCRAMRIADTFPKDVEKWADEYLIDVKHDIEEELRLAAQLRDADGDIPTVATLKDAMLVRIKTLIEKTDDPSKLATCYRVLSEFGKDSKRSASAKSAADIVSDRLQPKHGKLLERNEDEREYARIHAKDNQEEEEEF